MFAFLLYLTCYDIWFYFVHRLMHTKYLYFIHKIHHKKLTPLYYDYYTIHILELPLQSIGIICPVYFYKLHIFQLICVILFINLRGIMEHDISFPFFISNHHLMHHRISKYNYGEHWLDYLFGTLYVNKEKNNIKSLVN
jgi:sterol desaturase/sphingolipid hydroxylase (fatty acid hydroxylase superfamily)